MKTKKMILMILVVISLLVVAVLGTYAYVTFKLNPMTNVFTYGNVELELYQNSTSADNLSADQLNNNLKWGTYYEKDVSLKLVDGSSSCYAFIIVENELAKIESIKIPSSVDESSTEKYSPIHNQIMSIKNGWKYLSDISNEYTKVYWQLLEKDNNTYQIIENFRTANSFDYDDIYDLDNDDSAELSFSVYAVEKGDLENAEAAWTILKSQFSELAKY